MTRLEEQKLLQRVNNLEKEIARLSRLLENNKLDRHVYTIPEVAELLGVTRQGVYKMINRGELETVKLGSTKVLGSSLRSKLGA